MKNITLTIILGSVLSLTSSNTIAWDGYDYNDGSYKDVEVQGMSGNELEVYDYDTGEYRYLDMD